MTALCRPKRQNLEAQLQGSVVEFLRRALPFPGIVFHVANGGSRDKREAARLKWQGVLPGVPDLLVIYDGRVFGVELKSPKGQLSTEQAGMSETFAANGFAWTVARSLEQVERFLRAEAVPLKATVLPDVTL